MRATLVRFARWLRTRHPAIYAFLLSDETLVVAGLVFLATGTLIWFG